MEGEEAARVREYRLIPTGSGVLSIWINKCVYMCVKNNIPKFMLYIICTYLVYLKTFTEHLCCTKLLNGILFTTHI